MRTQLPWLKASDGTAAVDMQVALVTPWVSVGNKDRPSVQNIWGAGPVGAFSLQFTNVPDPVYNSAATDYPAAALGTTPTQPSGAADNAIIAVDAIGQCVRAAYTPTSGGTGILPTTWISYAPGDEV